MLVVHFQLKVQMRTGRPACHAHGADRIPLSDAKTLAQGGCNRLQMRIQRRVFAVVPSLDNVAVTALPTGERDNSFGNRAHVGAGGGRIVDSAVRSVVAENWMHAVAAEPRANARVLQRRL